MSENVGYLGVGEAEKPRKDEPMTPLEEHVWALNALKKVSTSPDDSEAGQDGVASLMSGKYQDWEDIMFERSNYEEY